MKKILVVENSPTIISVADSLLRQRGYDVICLSDGQKALESAQNEKPDLIITALGLDGLNGIELSKHISSDPLLGGIPIILLIGDKDSIYLDKIDLCGARARIKKPFSPKELLSVVEKYSKPGESIAAAKVVDQAADGAPKLKPKVAPQEIGTATNTTLAKNETNRQEIRKHETVFNLEWEDLNEEAIGQSGHAQRPDLNESGLILEEDQYGLTKLDSENAALETDVRDEDYDWFVGEMKKEIEDAGDKKESPKKSQSEAKPQVAYHDLGTRTSSKDEGKYRQFLDKFKQDANILTQTQPTTNSSIDVGWLVDRIADKLAQKIVEKLDKRELKQIIASFFNESK